MDRIPPFSAMGLQFKPELLLPTSISVGCSSRKGGPLLQQFLVRPHRSLRPTYINQLVNFPIAGNWHKLLHLHGRMFLSFDLLEHNDGP